jgi:hypothetical protein
LLILVKFGSGLLARILRFRLCCVATEPPGNVWTLAYRVPCQSVACLASGQKNCSQCRFKQFLLKTLSEILSDFGTG